MATASTSKKPERRTVRDLLHLLGWSADRKGSAGAACNLLADVVTRSGCRVWIGHLPAANDAHSVAGMLRQAADGDPERDSPIVSRGNLGAFRFVNLLDAELVVNDILKGLTLLGVDPPASLGGLNWRARKEGGKMRKVRAATQRVLNFAYAKLASPGRKNISLARVLGAADFLTANERDQLRVRSIQARQNPIRVTDAAGKVEETRRTSLWRYLKRARDDFHAQHP